MAVYMKIFLPSVRKKSVTENFVKRKLRQVSVSEMVQRILSHIADALYDFFFGDCETYNVIL